MGFHGTDFLGGWVVFPSEALSASSWKRYALVLTKLRIFQLDQKGLKKIVMMETRWQKTCQSDLVPRQPKLLSRDFFGRQCGPFCYLSMFLRMQTPWCSKTSMNFFGCPLHPSPSTRNLPWVLGRRIIFGRPSDVGPWQR